MTATEELCRMLDERGVEYEGGERSLRWRDRYGIMMQAFPLANGELGMGVWSCTPEQAVEATLGDADATGERQRDAVEVVRCSDCKWFDFDIRACKRRPLHMAVEPDGFCAWGEKGGRMTNHKPKRADMGPVFGESVMGLFGGAE